MATNYILSQMEEKAMPYSEALLEAQKLGYAESDPTVDVSGQDAASKAAIIAMVVLAQMYHLMMCSLRVFKI